MLNNSIGHNFIPQILSIFVSFILLCLGQFYKGKSYLRRKKSKGKLSISHISRGIWAFLSDRAAIKFLTFESFYIVFEVFGNQCWLHFNSCELSYQAVKHQRHTYGYGNLIVLWTKFLKIPKILFFFIF